MKKNVKIRTFVSILIFSIFVLSFYGCDNSVSPSDSSDNPAQTTTDNPGTTTGTETPVTTPATPTVTPLPEVPETTNPENTTTMVSGIYSTNAVYYINLDSDNTPADSNNAW